MGAHYTLEEVATCPICNTTDRRFLFTTKDRLHGLPGTFALVRCPNCDLIYLSPRPDRQSMLFYYPDNYIAFARRELPRWLNPVLRRWGGVARRCQAIERLTAPGRILDVGCATGDFLAGMQQRGWEVHGVELVPEAAARATARLGVPVFTGDLLAASFRDDYFDVVTLWNVFEHLFDPLVSLEEVYRILRPRGWLVLTLPNTESWAARLFGQFWVGWDSPRHLFLFSGPVLDRALRRVGFQPQGRECFYGSYTACMLSLRFLLAERWGDQAARLIDGWALNSLTLHALLAPWFYLVNTLNKGTMLTVYAQKPERKTSEGEVDCAGNTSGPVG
jgi:SAM-dependent methyltransferase